MTLGSNTVTITIDETPVVLNRINQDNYATQYYYRGATEEITLNVRHSKENPTKNGFQFDRHNVELIHTVFPTDMLPGKTRTTYSVIRNTRDDDYEAVEADVKALSDFMSDNVDVLLTWVS